MHVAALAPLLVSKGYGRAMARTQTMVQLTEELVETLDAEAVRRGLSRSALIRELVSDALQLEGQAAIGEQIAAGYRRIPQSEPDEWGDATSTADVATEELLVRLDAEDRDAGHGSW